MSALSFLIPIALFMGIAGLGAFLWSLRTGQYEDLDGAAERILSEKDDKPLSGSRIDCKCFEGGSNGRHG